MFSSGGKGWGGHRYLAVLSLLTFTSFGWFILSESPPGWTMFGQNKQNTHFHSQEKRIGPHNVDKLTQLWAYDTDANNVQINASFVEDDGDGGFRPVSSVVTTPAVSRSGKRVYFPDANGRLHAVNAETGEAIWIKSLLYDYFADDAAAAGVDIRKVFIQSRTTPVVFGNLLILGIKASGQVDVFNTASPGGMSWFGTPNYETAVTLGGPVVIAVNRKTGDLVWKTRITDGPLPGGKVTQPLGRITASLSIREDRVYGGVAIAPEEELVPDFLPLGLEREALLTAVYEALGVPIDTVDGKYKCCGAVGSTFALDAKTGKLIWATPTIDTEDPDLEVGFNGWSGVSVWGGAPAIDTKNRLVYVATGNAYNAPLSLAAEYDEVLANYAPAQGLCQDDPVCSAELNKLLPDNVHADSIMAMDLDSGEIKWSRPFGGLDIFSYTCAGVSVRSFFGLNMTRAESLDFCAYPYYYDLGLGFFDRRGRDININFGMAPMIVGGKKDPILLTGQKNGDVIALNVNAMLADPVNAPLMWRTATGIGSEVGGLQWGMASDGEVVFSQNTNNGRREIQLPGEAAPQIGGFFTAFDVSDGSIVWQVRDPRAYDADPDVVFRALPYGPLSLANGVVYATSMANSLYAIDAKTGAILWEKSDLKGAGFAPPAVVKGVVYWPTGYPDDLTFGLIPPTGLPFDNKVYAFVVPGKGKDHDDDDQGHGDDHEND